MDTPSENAVSTIDYLRPVWRFKWVALAIILVATVATYVFFDRKPRIYETSTQLYVGQSDVTSLLGTENANPSIDSRSLANQARLVTTPDVATVVIRRLRLNQTPDQLLESISVRPDSAADFLTVVATAPSATLAADEVNAFVQGYLQVRSGQAKKQIDVQLKVARSQLARTPMGKSNLTARTALRERVQELESASLNPQAVGEQLSSAQPPGSPIAPKPTRNAVFAAALAFLLSVVLAYVFDRSDRRLRSVEDVEAVFDTAILAAIPRTDHAIPSHGSRDVITAELKEPYQTLRVNLELLRSKREHKTFLVTSASPGEGKSTVIRNLALAYRDAGLRVAVVDADLRRPSIAAFFDLARAPGTAEVLQGSTQLRDALQPLSPERAAPGSPSRSPLLSHGDGRGAARRGTLDVLVAGDGGEAPGLLFYPVAVRDLIGKLEESYDIVLIDTPPVLVVSDALAVAPEVGGVILVGRIGVTTDALAQRLQRTFDGVPQTEVIGAVVNAIPLAASYNYYGQYSATEVEDVAASNGSTVASPEESLHS